MLDGLEDVVRRIAREEAQRLLERATVLLEPRRTSTREMVTITDAAASVSLSAKTLRGWISEGRLKSYGKGRGVRVRKTDVIRCMEEAAVAEETEEDTDSKVERILSEG